MASRDLKDLHYILSDSYPKAELKFKQLYPNLPQPFRTCTYRSGEEQEQLFLQKPKVTQARAGQSPHNYLPSLAFDIAFIGVNKKLDWNFDLFKKFYDIIKEIEPRVEWGGNWKFKDAPHYQLFNWQNYIPEKNKNIITKTKQYEKLENNFIGRLSSCNYCSTANS